MNDRKLEWRPDWTGVFRSVKNPTVLERCESGKSLAVGEVPDPVSQARAAPFKARRRAKLRARRVAAIKTQRLERRGGVAHGQHLLRVFLPVGRQPQYPAALQLVGQQRGEHGVDQAALMVPLLVPWVGKEDQDLIEGLVLNGELEDLDGIVAHNP